MLKLVGVVSIAVLAVVIRGTAAEPPAVDPKTLQNWVHALEDRDPEVSLRVARSWVDALGGADPAVRKRAVAVLRAGITHFSPEVRERAVKVLGRIGPDAKGAVPALIEMLSDPDDQVI